jgi:cell division protein FtsB
VATFETRGGRGGPRPVGDGGAFAKGGAAAARPQRHVRPASYLLVSFLSSVLLFAFFLVGDRGFLQVRRQRQELANVKERVSQLATANERLEAEIAALKSEPAAAEKIAREDLGLVREGEVILELPKGWRQRVAPGAPTRPKPGPR